MRKNAVTDPSPLRPLVIGIAGGTGSGKSTVAHKLATSIPVERCAVIDHDSYYVDQSHLSPQARAEINYDHPSSLESRLLAEHLRELRAGRAVEVPIYDFVTHCRRPETRRVPPAPVIIVEGILVHAHPVGLDQPTVGRGRHRAQRLLGSTNSRCMGRTVA